VFRHLTSVLETKNDRDLVELFAEPSGISDWLSRWTKRLDSENKDAALAMMKSHNPVYIPRNHRIEEVIQAAYAGDLAPFEKLADVTQAPFSHSDAFKEFEAAPEPDQVVQATFCGT
jgi:uncharacterized protein YdiU (UPF0061 family)